MTNRKIKYRPENKAIAEVASKHGSRPESVLEVLREVQEIHGGLTQELIGDVSRALRIPEERAYGIATFYTMLSLRQDPPAKTDRRSIRVCDGPVCWLKGAPLLHQLIVSQLGDHWRIERNSCLGLCDRAPAALVGDQQAGPLTAEKIGQIPHGFRGAPTDYSNPLPGELRVMMAQAGKIDPDSLSSAQAHDAYRGLEKCLQSTPEATLAVVEASGLTGRGGAGFPVGRKWRFVAQANNTPKYIICNADESEPLIFKDRVLIDTNPHQILEGMVIAGYATGAHEAFIYIRGEYEHQAQRLENAIHQAEQANYLGENILGSGFSFHIHVHRGAGAYICGEETALIESLEGKRGEPRFRPPYPPTYGYLGKPTLVNNVESYAAVPSILRNGSDWYRSLSSAPTPGTKIYMILGHVCRPGLFEAPFGITLRQAIDQFGGGMLPGSNFHFALTGGAAGTIVPESLLDIPIDYASASKGVALGAGAFLVCDQSVSPVAFLRELLHFFQVESCGKCTPCRLGTFDSLEILQRLAQRQGAPGDLERLHLLSEVMKQASFCGLGQSVATPVQSALTHFAADFTGAIQTPNSSEML
jgi:NADH:ubiquinone oxidoreductase subunit F (NADH-binding)/NADH:ubiquinone oxidoreductase subunit E